MAWKLYDDEDEECPGNEDDSCVNRFFLHSEDFLEEFKEKDSLKVRSFSWKADKALLVHVVTLTLCSVSMSSA
jgi:hypothetical protein